MPNNIQQPIGSGFGRETLPNEILNGIDLSGRRFVVTGGYSGIGLETVRALVDAGAKVTVPARAVSRAKEALTDLGCSVSVAEMDLADLSSVKRFADRKSVV